MQNRAYSDRLLKEIATALLGPMGQLQSEVEILADSKRIDLCFRPEPTKNATRTSLGALGRMTTERCALEGFHNPPGVFTVLRCVAKQLLWRERLERDAERAARLSSGDKARASVVPLPPLWVISGGVPRTALRDMGCQPMEGWPNGFYESVPALRFHVVIPSELPETVDTLALRLMGTKQTRRRAMVELRSRRHDEPWTHLVEQLTALGEVFSQTVQTLTSEEEDFMAEARKLVREIEEEAREEGIQTGQKSLLLNLIEIRLKRKLSSEEVAAFHAHFDALGEKTLGMIDGLDASALAAWLSRPSES